MYNPKHGSQFALGRTWLPTLLLVAFMAVGTPFTSKASDEKPADSGISTAATVEYLVFNLIDGANPDDFLKETLGVDSVLAEYDGFVARHLARNDDGSWVEVVYWESLEDAEAALPRFTEDPRAQGFLALVDGESIVVKYSALIQR